MDFTSQCDSENHLFSMRSMKEPDFEVVRHWCLAEGWNLGLYDASAYYRADPSGHHLFFENNDPVGSISLVKHDNDFYSLGPFIVRKENRQQGYGDTIWQRAFAQANQHPKAVTMLYAVFAQVQRYEKQGFRSIFINQRWQMAENSFIPLSSDYVCEPITAELVPIISQYDKTIFSTSREIIFSEILKQKNTHGFFIRDDNQVKGFGIIRPCINGYRVGPLMADNVEIAKALFAKLTHLVGNRQIILDVPEDNQEANKMLSNFGLEPKPEFNTVAMIKGTPKVSFKQNFIRHYAIFSLEIG